jgi:acyl carrier protein
MSTGTETTRDIESGVREVLSAHGRLPVAVESLGAEDDLYRAGLTSHASVGLMLALEDAFDVEFPDRMLTRGVFESVASISAALAELLGG